MAPDSVTVLARIYMPEVSEESSQTQSKDMNGLEVSILMLGISKDFEVSDEWTPLSTLTNPTSTLPRLSCLWKARSVVS